MERVCDGWEFVSSCSDAFLRGERVDGAVTVRLPHTVCEVPLQYADESTYQMISGYRKHFPINKKDGMRYFVCFEGAAHIAEVFAGGSKIAEHRCGYTAFEAEITDHISDGGCTVAVRLDSTENPEIPPFGMVVDYLTFGGLYRPVRLEERPSDFISDVFVCTPDTQTVRVSVAMETAQPCGSGGESLGRQIRFEIADRDGKTVFTECRPCGGAKTEAEFKLPGLNLWSLEEPYLYTLRCTLVQDAAGGSSRTVRFGVRTAVFTADGFFLNGEKIFLRGLNRHQNYPYIGYAATASLQRFDAWVLKNELKVNAVRTSHYPQSQDFIDACDELGLPVFTEIPGWQHIGDSDGWRRQVMTNTEEMVVQYRNHPSIILWGVRINESVDCDELYTLTNRLAHELDPSRATSGVRYLEKSSLLEDVYAFNDFSYAGKGTAAKPRSRVSPDKNRAFLISECNGHMFPTKPWDTWLRREEHALRHAAVMNDAMADGSHAGCLEWCMFDYPTHRDFGSGDRVCYHGVLDYFRNPKLAAAFYASQDDDAPVLEVSSSMDIGDYAAGRLERFYVFTNADSVRLYKNGDFVTEIKESAYKALKHGPLCVDDTIGCLLETKEGFTGRKEKLLHKALVSAARYGVAGLPLTDLLRMGWCMFRYRLSFADGVELFGKYVGNWGGEAVVWNFEAVKDGKVVASRRISPSAKLHMEVRASKTLLCESETYDMALVRIRLLDEFGSPAVYESVPVSFETEGCIEIAGPSMACTQGGATGCIIRTVGREGTGILKIIAPAAAAPTAVSFEVKTEQFPEIQ